MAESIVGRPTVSVRENLVRLVDLLEAILRRDVVLVDVRVELAGEVAVCLLEFVCGGAPADAEYLVVVALVGHGIRFWGWELLAGGRTCLKWSGRMASIVVSKPASRRITLTTG
jgi:hypothetical protein